MSNWDQKVDVVPLFHLLLTKIVVDLHFSLEKEYWWKNRGEKRFVGVAFEMAQKALRIRLQPSNIQQVLICIQNSDWVQAMNAKKGDQNSIPRCSNCISFQSSKIQQQYLIQGPQGKRTRITLQQKVHWLNNWALQLGKGLYRAGQCDTHDWVATPFCYIDQDSFRARASCMHDKGTILHEN